ncbi:ATP-binding cassette domain-containing protein [Microbacterium sp. NPDC077663]|uniref:ATP-binding cassette domain-containing protein n=1 Tax=Microbacterium sp. NPDC077663 TaxID=3364189 RepID=UPI0037CC6482
MTFRPGPLRAAAAVAAGFVVVRVLYRILFGGADGDGAVLLDLPSWRLPAPFAHVEVLGPVTSGGIAAAAASALPIAVPLLIVGALVAVLDVPRLLARGARRGPLQGLARALALAWATLPALADAVRATRRAARLRGERPGVRLLAPVLERTLQRAVALGTALELRGYAGAGETLRADPVVQLAGAAWGFGDRAVATVERLDLAAGTLTLVVGPTGVGKSTVLRGLAGLHTTTDGGWSTGTIDVIGMPRDTRLPRDTARSVGTVLQDPRQGFAAEQVRDEIGLALELRGAATPEIDTRVAEVAMRTGVDALLDRRVAELSAGEATLVAIAAAIVDEPALLLVDEPLADLDTAARARIAAVLADLAHRSGVCVVVAEHRVREFADVVDDVVSVGTRDDVPLPRPSARAIGGAVLDAHGVTVRHGARTAVDGADLRIAAGEIVAVQGPNGAGKSSLLTALALGAAGVQATGSIALVPDASDDLFVRDTVEAECRHADRRARVPGTAALFFDLLGVAPDSPTADAVRRRHPLDLSTGQRRCLAIAIQCARRPAALLVDEPTRGLDPAARALVAAALVRTAEAGTAVVFATHDAELARVLADRALRIEAGVLRAGVVASDPETVTGSGPFVPPASDSDGVVPIRGRADAAPARPGSRGLVLLAANLLAAGAFAWPLVAAALPSQAQAAAPVIALALAPLAVLLVATAVDASIRSAHTLALLATLAAIGGAIRLASTGVGGVEALFVLLILAGRAYGARFGMLLGAASLLLSSLVWGGVGPWLPFQMFACGWVAAGAALLPTRVRGRGEIVLLAIYGVVASYLFGLVMNLWFWPFAVGGGTTISYQAGAPMGENLASFLLYSLVTSTAGWDTVRAVTTVVGIVLVARPVLRSLRRVKPVSLPVAPSAAPEPVATVRSL